MKALPLQYQDLAAENGPKILTEALKLYGTLEKAGAGNNPQILGWADALGLDDYTADSIAWCGLFVAIVCARAEKPVVKAPLWARNWCNWGVVTKYPELGDILVFSREGGGGHVGFYVGEDEDFYHVLGGNQSDQVSVTRVAKSRCIGKRTPVWKIAKPANVRRIYRAASGKISVNEA